MYYLNFWSAFANEWSERAAVSEADSVIPPVHTVAGKPARLRSAPRKVIQPPRIVKNTHKKPAALSALLPAAIIEIPATPAPVESASLPDPHLPDPLAHIAPIMSNETVQTLEPSVWPEDWSSLVSHNIEDAKLTRKVHMLLDELVAQLSEETSEKICVPEAQKYNYLTQYGTQILALFTPDLGCTYLSQNFDTLTGNEQRTSMGADFFALVHEDYYARLHDIVFAPIVAGAKPQNLRCKFQHGDSKYYWYQLTIHSNENEYVCMMENIHESIQTQNTLQKAKLEAELALRARSEFLANMSHDLRTPLNAVIGFSQIMESGVFGKIDVPQYNDYVHHINQSGYDLLAKIEDLLEIASIDAGRMTLEREEVYVDDLIRHVKTAHIHHAQAANITLNYVPKGNPLLFVDRLKLQHILGHLVANSIKFSHNGGRVSIEVSRSQNTKFKGGVEFTVRDNGIGMSNMQCHDIRTALAQDNCWTAKNSHSIGIGLALTKEFVALHGGEVNIQSNVGVGTSITITLPRECMRMSPARAPETIRTSELTDG